MVTVSNGEPTRKDTNMKLLYFFTAFLALSLADDAGKQAVKEIENNEDSAAESTNIELLKEVADLTPAASSHTPQGQRERRWQSQRPNQPVNTWVQPVAPVPAVQNDYYWSSSSAPQPSTTPVSVLKNEIYYGDNGHYKYEYQIADGTHVAEEGYYTDPKQTEESLVKKGWYSFLGADGKTYTVNYWADYTGYHAYGSHLPSAAQVPANPPQQQTSTQRPTYYPSKPTYTPAANPPQNDYYPPQPTYTPSKPTYNPPQNDYYPAQPAYTPPQKPTYNPPQNDYYPAQSANTPPQKPTYNPPQNDYYPAQPVNTPPQNQIYQQNQPNYNQQQQQTYYPNYNY